jgi:hypothetical protein
MKEDLFYSPYVSGPIYEIRIEREDIEQALSWFDRMPINQATHYDEKTYAGLRKVVSHMRALEFK